MPSNRDDLLVFVALIAIVVGTIVLAAVLPAAPAPAFPSAASFGDREPTCDEWTDGCVVCQRIDGEEHCSMPGIACVRGATQCLRR